MLAFLQYQMYSLKLQVIKGVTDMTYFFVSPNAQTLFAARGILWYLFRVQHHLTSSAPVVFCSLSFPDLHIWSGCSVEVVCHGRA